MSVTVVGLGQMGLPVAAALAGQGVRVLASDKDPARIAMAVAHGAIAASHAEALAQPLVLTLLPSDGALMGLCCAPHGLLARLPPGGVHLCLGTIGVATAQALEAAHAEAGQAFVACPVFGRPEEAWERDLTAVFGAAADVAAQGVAEARRVVSLFAPRLHAVPSPAAACAVKLAGNGLIAAAIGALTEAFGLVQAHGVAPPLLHAIVTGKLFRGPVYEGVGAILAGAVPAPAVPAFTIDLGLKDLSMAHDAAQAAGLPMPVSEAVRARLADAARAGHGARDWADLPRCLPPSS